jgi:hypothetical protein
MGRPATSTRLTSRGPEGYQPARHGDLVPVPVGAGTNSIGRVLAWFRHPPSGWGRPRWLSAIDLVQRWRRGRLSNLCPAVSRSRAHGVVASQRPTRVMRSGVSCAWAAGPARYGRPLPRPQCRRRRRHRPVVPIRHPARRPGGCLMRSCRGWVRRPIDPRTPAPVGGHIRRDVRRRGRLHLTRSVQAVPCSETAPRRIPASGAAVPYGHGGVDRRALCRCGRLPRPAQVGRRPPR